MQFMRLNSSSETGMTLVEVIIQAVLIGIVALLVTRIAAGSFTNMNHSKRMATANRLVRQVLEEEKARLSAPATWDAIHTAVTNGGGTHTRALADRTITNTTYSISFTYRADIPSTLRTRGNVSFTGPTSTTHTISASVLIPR